MVKSNEEEIKDGKGENADNLEQRKGDHEMMEINKKKED